MRRPARIHRPVIASLTLACLTAAWWGCSAGNEGPSTATTFGTGGSSSGTGGSGTGAGPTDIDAGTGGGVDEAGACTSTSASAHRIPVDILFLIDRSGSMHGAKWTGTKSALTTFFDDPDSVGIGAGMVYFPSLKADSCQVGSYEIPDVSIDVLPGNSFALTNSMPADATGVGTPTYVAMKGALMTATAYQDAHPTHKVILVLSTDGDPYLCGAGTIDDIAALAASARNYNGVLTYVIGVAGSVISSLDKIAAAGGTIKSYDITQDINLFTAKIAEIRNSALGCDYAIPPSPTGMQIDPNDVNFTYTPKGIGNPKLLPRADDLADCNGQPGWYYDNNNTPTKIVLCPASCTTVSADHTAKVDVLFGCKSVPN
jgi:uncharacterized protein YegL